MLGILSTVGTVVTVAFAVLLVLFILINVLRGLAKGIIPAALNLVGIFLAGISAIFIAVPLGKVLSKIIMDTAMGFVNSNVPQIGEFTEISPIIGELTVAIPTVIMTPILYMAVFLLLLGVFAIPIYFVKKFFKTEYPDLPKNGWAGAICGAVAGCALFVFLFSPIVGTFSMVGDAADVVIGIMEKGSDSETENDELANTEIYLKPVSAKADDAAEENDIAAYGKAVNSITDNFMFKFVSGVGGKAIYNSLTVFELKGEKVSVSKEFAVMADVFDDLSPLFDGGKPSNWGKEEADGIRKAAKDLGKSRIVSEVLADVISAASESWSKDEKFIGISMIQTGRASVDNFLAELFNTFKDTTVDTVSEDFGTLADVFGVMIEYKLLADIESGANITDTIAKEGFITDLLKTVMENDRFAGVSAAVINLGVHETLGILNVPETKSDVYDRFVDDVAKTINSANENSTDIENVKSDVYKHFADNGVEVEKEVTDYVTEYLMADFAGRTDVSDGEVGEFFAVAFASLENGGSADGASGISSDSLGGDIIFLENKYSGAKELNSIFGDIIENGGSTPALENVNWEGLSTLTDRETFETSAVTAESLKVSKEAITALSSEELLTECQKLEEMIGSVTTFTSSLENAGGDILGGSDVKALGQALNALDTSIILSSVSGSMIEAALKSDMVQNNVAISDETVKTMIYSDDTDYENILVSVQNTNNIIAGLGKPSDSGEEMSEEELNKNLAWLLGDMSESTAGIIGDIFDAETVIKLGIPEENAEKIANTVNVFFAKMAASKADTSDPNDKDVKASKTIFKFISALKHPSTNVFEQTGLTVEETVHIFMDSEISRETLVGAAYENDRLVVDAFGLSGKVSDSDKATLENILKSEAQKNYSSAKDKTEYERSICAIGAILGIDVSRDFHSWVR